jgi:hypothetical protein
MKPNPGPISTLTMLAALLSGSLAVSRPALSAPLSRAEALVAIRQRLPEGWGGWVKAKDVSLKPHPELPAYTLSCVDEAEECFVLKKDDATGGTLDLFDALAEKLGPARAIFRHYVDVGIDEKREWKVDLANDASHAFAVETGDPKVLSETLRNLHGYSGSMFPRVVLSRTDNPLRDPRVRFATFAFPQAGTALSEFPASKAWIGSFAPSSPEIFDGIPAELIRNPDAIAKTPFSKDGMVSFVLWRTYLDALVDSSGKVLVDRVAMRLAPYGPHAGTVHYLAID